MDYNRIRKIEYRPNSIGQSE
ncbi:MAG: hypothetical protein ACD_7C00414G0002, partial [uncultured bacterium]